MGEEQLKILSMLKEGKISVEEAERLLRLVGSESRRDKKTGEISEFARDLPDAVSRGMREAFKAVGEVGRTVGKKGKQLLESGGEHMRKKYHERPFKVKLAEGVNEVKVVAETTAGMMVIGGVHDDSEALARGTHKTISSEVVEFTLNNETPTYGTLIFDAKAGSLDSALNPAIIYDFDIENAAGAVKLDLTDLRARAIDVENSAGMVVVKLGNLIHEVKVDVNNSAGKVKVVVPPDAGVKIAYSGQMGTHNLDEIGLARDGEFFVTDGFETAETKIYLDVTQTVGVFRLKRG